MSDAHRASHHRVAGPPEDANGAHRPGQKDHPFGLLFTRAVLEHLPQPETTLGPYIVKGGVNMLYGRWGSAKSFLLLSWAAHLSTGIPWNDHETEPCNVIYWAAEGRGGLHMRLEAWEQYHGARIPDLGFRVPEKSPSLDQAATYDALAELVESIEARHLFIDTLIRVKGQLRENEADELGGYLLTELAHRICDEYGTSVTLAHHVGHEAKERPRGSSSITDNLDALYEIRDSGTGIKSLHVRKLKDQPSDLPPDHFRLVSEGESAVLIPTGDVPLSDAGQDVMEALEQASRVGEGWVTQDRLKQISGRSRNTVRDTLTPLIGDKVSQRLRPGKPTEYRLIETNPQPSLEVSNLTIVHPISDKPDPF